jgi:hypothetical protein
MKKLFVLVFCVLSGKVLAQEFLQEKIITRKEYRHIQKDLKSGILDSMTMAQNYFLLGQYFMDQKRWIKAKINFEISRSILFHLIGKEHSDYELVDKYSRLMFRRSISGVQRLDIELNPEFSFHIGQRQFQFPVGDIGITIPSINGEKVLHSTHFETTKKAYTVDFNVMRIGDNMLFLPFKNSFRENTYGFFSIRTGLVLMPNNQNNQGFSFLADFGLDGGFMHVPHKRIALEFGVKAVPFAMSYSYFTRLSTPHIMPSGNTETLSIDFAQNQFFISLSPYLKTSIFLTKPKKDPIIALDLSLGWHFTHTYGRWLQISISNEESVDLSREDFVFNGVSVKNNTFSLNGKFSGVGLRWIF